MKALGYSAVWEDPVVFSDQGARAHHCVTANLYIIAYDCAELKKPGWNRAAFHWNLNIINEVFHLFLKTAELHVGQARSRSHIDVASQYAITNVIEMTCLHMVHQYGVFNFRAVTYHTTVAHHDIASHVGPLADIVVFTDDCRTLDDGRRLQSRSTTNSDA